MALKLIGIGGLGLMLSPSAKHLSASGPAAYCRIHDRGTRDTRRDACRKAWLEHGAELVGDFQSLVKDGDFDGVVICAGKNGDDLEILRELSPLLKKRCSSLPFILHLSTLSAGFVTAAYEHFSTLGIDYANYPLTGGPKGAESGAMLILSSGKRSLYERVEPMLNAIGCPRFFSENVSRGAEVKLIGQLMVFCGLTGISSAAALHTECFGGGFGGAGQTEFFDFLNNGAGGTKQWDVALRKGLAENIWDQGFMLQHAVVDAIYAAELCVEKAISRCAALPMLTTALSFAFLLRKFKGEPIATHALARELLRESAKELDEFVISRLRSLEPRQALERCVDALPEQVKRTVKLDIALEDL